MHGDRASHADDTDEDVKERLRAEHPTKQHSLNYQQILGLDLSHIFFWYGRKLLSIAGLYLDRLVILNLEPSSRQILYLVGSNHVEHSQDRLMSSNDRQRNPQHNHSQAHDLEYGEHEFVFENFGYSSCRRSSIAREPVVRAGAQLARLKSSWPRHWRLVRGL